MNQQIKISCTNCDSDTNHIYCFKCAVALDRFFRFISGDPATSIFDMFEDYSLADFAKTLSPPPIADEPSNSG